MIIVTGGAGFIGSAFVWKCNKEGIRDIWIVDNLASTDKWKNLNHLHFSEYFQKSVFLEMLSDGLPDDVEAIIHMGACSSTTERDVDYLMDNNVLYSKLLAEFCISEGIPFIYASSAATYGGGEHGFKDDMSLIDNLRPINPYGFSKQLFDKWIIQNGHLDSVTGLKFFNVYGPNEYHKGAMRSVICKAYDQIMETGKISLFKSYREEYPNGGQMRDFIYVKDCVEVMWWLLKNPDVTGIYNVGTGQSRTWNDVAAALFQAMDKPLNIEYIDMPPELKGQYQYYTEADISRLKMAGCPVRFTPLEEAVQEYVRYYLSGKRHLFS